MDILIFLFAALALGGGGIYLWRRRRPTLQGLTEQDFLNVSRGIVHPTLEAACRDMLVRVSDRVTRYYRVEDRSSPYALPLNTINVYDYTHLTLLDLAQQIELVDSFPDGARGNSHRAGPGAPAIIGLVRGHLEDLGHLQHELLHCLTWDRPELKSQCDKDPEGRGHWRVIFQDLIGD